MPALEAGERTALTRGAWVDVHTNWIAGADDVLATLVAEVPWRAERRQMYDRVVDVPRLVHTYGDGRATPAPAARRGTRERSRSTICPELGEPFLTAGCCYYRDGRDSVAWHGDTIGRGKTRGHDGRDRVLRRPTPADAPPARAAASHSRSRWATATCWSWAAPASGPGSTASPRWPAPGRASRCSSGRSTSSDRDRSREVRLFLPLGEVFQPRVERTLAQLATNQMTSTTSASTITPAHQ